MVWFAIFEHCILISCNPTFPEVYFFQRQTSPSGRFGHYINFDRFAEGYGALYAGFRLRESLQALAPGTFRNFSRCLAPVGIVSQQQPHFNLTWFCRGKNRTTQTRTEPFWADQNPTWCLKIPLCPYIQHSRTSLGSLPSFSSLKKRISRLTYK